MYKVSYFWQNCLWWDNSDSLHIFAEERERERERERDISYNYWERLLIMQLGWISRTPNASIYLLREKEKMVLKFRRKENGFYKLREILQNLEIENYGGSGIKKKKKKKKFNLQKELNLKFCCFLNFEIELVFMNSCAMRITIFVEILKKKKKKKKKKKSNDYTWIHKFSHFLVV